MNKFKVLFILILLFTFESYGNSFITKKQTLQGKPDDNAAKSIQNVFNLEGAAPVKKAFDTSIGYFVLTRLDIEVKNTATVGDVNSFLKENNALILSSIKGTDEITISIPDPGGVEKYKSFVEKIKKLPWVLDVYYVRPAPIPPKRKKVKDIKYYLGL